MTGHAITVRAALAALLVAPFPALARAQSGDTLAAQPRTYHARRGETRVSLPRDTGTVSIDGSLDEPQWRDAALLTGFSLYQPQDGLPAPDSTEALVWYSSDALYVGIRAYEPHGAVHATLADRDRVSADDNVEIQLDTYHDRRRAFVFIVNPLGVQADGTKNEGGGFIPGSNVMPGQNDLSADFVWQSKGHVTPWGYEVEVRIPFSSLRYPVAMPQTWGIQLDRHVQHSGYDETWTPAVRASASFVTQYGQLVGLSGMHHGQTVELNPELTTTASGTMRASDSAWTYRNKPVLGGNVRWGMGSNFVLNGTIRPDFSQVESDALQIASDPRFALFYPERRPFFVEGSDQFNVPNTLVYTRRIVQPAAAAKITGRVGSTDVAVLAASDDRSTSSTGAHPFVGIVRLNRSFGTQNTAGLLYSDRTDRDRYNRMVGGDVHVVFSRLYYWQVQAVGSLTDDGSTAGAKSAPMWEAVVDRTGRAFGFHYGLLGIGNGFQAWNGFVPRTNIVQPSIANRFTLYGAPGSFIERYQVFNTIGGTWHYDEFFRGDPVLEQRFNLSNNFTLHGGWNVGISPGMNHYRFEQGDYAGGRVVRAPGDTVPFVPAAGITTGGSSFSISTPQFARFAASVGGALVRDVEFSETAPVKRADANASIDWRPTSRVRATASYLESTLRRRDDASVVRRTRIPRLRMEYQLSRSIFVRAVGQYESREQGTARDAASGGLLLGTGGCASATPCRTNDFRSDLLFSYRPAPGTVFFLGYGSDLTEPDPLAFRQLRRTGDAFFLKASYAFR